MLFEFDVDIGGHLSGTVRCDDSGDVLIIMGR